MIWHSSSRQDVCAELNTDAENGLYFEEAEKRLKHSGKNIVTDRPPKPFYQRLVSQLSLAGFIVLTVFSAISLVTALALDGNVLDAVTLFLLAVIWAVIGAAARHYSAEVSYSLKSIDVPQIKVIRDKQEITLPADELVVGDIMVISEGDYISADARLIESKNLHCDESLITGDSVPVEKIAESILDDIVPLNERSNMIYSGCKVCSGEGVAVVTATGNDTEQGRIEKIKKIDKTVSSSPLKARVITVSSRLTVVAAAACGLVFLTGVIGLLFDRSDFAAKFIEFATVCAALAVAVLPQALVIATEFIVSANLKKSAKRQILIKKPFVVEELGNVSVICCDKTGNMTEGKMAVERLFDGNSFCDYESNINPLPSSFANLLTFASICNDATLSFENSIPIASGDPNDAAIVYAMARSFKHSKDELDGKYPRLGLIPFTRARDMMTTLNMIEGRVYAVTKGAPEEVLARCNNIDKDLLNKAVNDMAGDGLRVLAVAYKPLDEAPLHLIPEEIEQDFYFSGLIGISDPISPSAIKEVENCKNAGVRTVMVTGDHLLTASAAAQKLGILQGDTKAVSHEELEKMSDGELAEQIKSISVFARATANDKLRIVRALQACGERVIMTGDGTMDQEALAEADIGCSFGKVGSDVAKTSSDMTVLDDRFASIAQAVVHGRVIFSNIRKALHYILCCDLALIFAFLLTVLIFGTAPINATELLVLSFIFTTLPAFALGDEGADAEILCSCPRDKKEEFLNKGIFIEMLWQGGVIGASAFAGYLLGSLIDGGSAALGKATAFTVLLLATLFLSFTARSVKESFMSLGAFANKKLLVSAGITVFILIAITLTPLRFMFGIPEMSGKIWLIAIILSVMPLMVCEGVKLVRKLLIQIKNETK